MRTVTWLLVLVAIGAVARADSPTGTVIVGCNEADAELVIDGVLVPEHTPAVLTLSAGTHVIEARKPPLVAQKQVVEVIDQHQIKLRFELLPPAAPEPPAAPSVSPPAGAGSAQPPPADVPPAPPSTAAIEVVTTVANSIVYVDGAPLHAAPCVLEVEPGEHVVAVYAAGMVPAETVVRLEAARRQHIELTPSMPRRRIDVPAQ
jgi:hypothetical protein